MGQFQIHATTHILALLSRKFTISYIFLKLAGLFQEPIWSVGPPLTHEYIESS